MLDALDNLRLKSATALASRIEDYWKARGHRTVKATIVDMGCDHTRVPIYAVRSNLVNGHPPEDAA